jgi:hypothetical protein
VEAGKPPLDIEKGFKDSPKLHHLLDNEEWQTLCMLKTHPTFAKVHHAMWMWSCDRTIFVTGKDSIGTALCSIRESDLVVRFAGVDKPMILRLVDESDESFRVVGPA